MTGGRRLDGQKVAAARLWAAHRFPYLASALFATTVVPTDREGVIGVDRHWRLYVDPALVDGWSVDELGSLFVHHTGHLVRDHAARARTVGVGDDAVARWNTAADAELNDDLAEAGVTVPGEAVLPELLGFERGRLAEEYFHRLDREPRPDAPSCGSGADDRPKSWEDEPGEGGEGLSDDEGELLRTQVAQEVLAAAREGRGTVPANWLRWAEELLDPKIDWRKVLAAEIRRGVMSVSGRVDYTYRRPSRRASASPDVVLPALQQPVPEVAVVCDTSGSMGAGELARVLAEVEGLLAGIGLRRRGVRVLAVDAAVQSIRRVSSARRIELTGGGGTDMRRGIEAAAALKPRPSVVVVLTDGMTPWPAEGPRGMRVIVGIIDSSVSRGDHGWAPPGWARVVRIDAA